LSEVLGGDDPIDLQPFDTVRILGRYEADAPNVFVFGQVLRPGKYPLAEGMTAAGLVRMAGGLKRSAFTQEADIASYVVRNGSNVVTKHATVEITKLHPGEKLSEMLVDDTTETLTPTPFAKIAMITSEPFNVEKFNQKLTELEEASWRGTTDDICEILRKMNIGFRSDQERSRIPDRAPQSAPQVAFGQVPLLPDAG
jgi:hypothetical protein